MQTLKKLHWLEITEYVTLIGAFIALGFAAVSKLWLFPLSLLLIALLLNVFNRLRLQVLQRKRMSAMARQLQRQFQDEIQSFNPVNPPSPLPPPPQALDESALGIVTESLGNIEQSIKTIIQYLNTHALPERMDRVESLNRQLQEEISQITGKTFSSLSSPSFSAPSDPITPPETPAPSAPSTPSLPIWQSQHTLKDHQEAVSCLALLMRDQPYLISGSWDQSIKVWELKTGHLKMSFKGHEQGILALAVSQADSSSILATGSFDQTIHLWSISDLQNNQAELSLIKTLTAHTGSVHALATLDNILVSGSYDQTVKQWDLISDEMITSSLDASGAIYAVAVNKEQRFIASGGGDGKISLWQPETGELFAYLSGNLSSVESLSISPDGQTIAAGCVDGKIKIWQVNRETLSQSSEFKPIQQLNAHQGHVKALCFSHDGQYLYSGGADGYVHLWHSSSDQALSTLTIDDNDSSRPDAILSLVLSQDGVYLVAGNARGIIRVWQKQ